VTRFIKHLSPQSRIFVFALGLALLTAIVIGDYITSFELDLSVLYLAPCNADTARA
jgi:hypothetical protein